MGDSLYIVRYTENDEPVVLGVIRKIKDDRYLSFLDTNNIFKRRVVSANVSESVPQLLLTRTYSPKRKDIGRLLERHGLEKFDAWELVKRTEGRLATDDVRFVVKSRLADWGIDTPLLSDKLKQSIIKPMDPDRKDPEGFVRLGNGRSVRKLSRSLFEEIKKESSESYKLVGMNLFDK